MYTSFDFISPLGDSYQKRFVIRKYVSPTVYNIKQGQLLLPTKYKVSERAFQGSSHLRFGPVHTTTSSYTNLRPHQCIKLFSNAGLKRNIFLKFFFSILQLVQHLQVFSILHIGPLDFSYCSFTFANLLSSLSAESLLFYRRTSMQGNLQLVLDYTSLQPGLSKMLSLGPSQKLVSAIRSSATLLECRHC